MKRSHAVAAARSCARVADSKRFSFVGPIILSLCLPWLTGCIGVSSGSHSSQATSGQQLIVSGSFPTTEVGVAYNGVLTAADGKAPYSYSVLSGTIPTGLSLSSAGSITGTPTQTGTFFFTVQATDSAGATGSNSFQVTVEKAGSVIVTVTPATPAVSSGGQQQFSATVTNTSNVGVTWSASTGTISSSGLYTAPSVSTTQLATVTATSTADSTASGTAAVTINAGSSATVSITTGSIPNATSGVTYSSSFEATGGTAPYSWTILSGTLPIGLALSNSGTLSGPPNQLGQFNFTIQASDSATPQQTASKTFTLNVSNAVSGPTISNFFFAADFNAAKNWPPTDGLGQPATLTGIRLWDDGVKWAHINTSDGVYDFSQLDLYLGNAESLNMDVLYTFGDTPQFAAITTPPGTCLTAGPFSCAPPIDVNADGTGTDAYFQAFVTALVTHSAGRIAYYELWNEPDCNCFWTGTTAQLVRMSQDAAIIIRSIDPNAKILSPSAHGWSMAHWFDDFVAAGGASYFDIVNVHMRGQDTSNASPEQFLTVWGQVQSEVQARNLTSLPIWDDEHGIRTTDGLTDPDELAGYVARSVILRAGVGGLQRQYVYMWDSAAPYGLQGNLAGTAWDQTASWLLGHSISPCVATGTVYTCELDNGEIVWDTAQSCSNGTCTTSSYAYPTKYAWYRVTSNASQTPLTGSTVQIGYKPILLTSQ